VHVLNAGELRRGQRVELDGEPYVVLDVHFQTPSARGASTLVKVKVRNFRTGNVFERTLKAADRLVEPELELRPVQYLYADGETFHFMDTQSYEQFTLAANELGDDRFYLLEGLEGLRSVVYNGRVISLDLPSSVVLRVEQTDPALKGATAQAQTKPATLETGLVVQVPSYLESGESVQVETGTGRFIARVKV
jgi:elongation factor P